MQLQASTYTCICLPTHTFSKTNVTTCMKCTYTHSWTPHIYTCRERECQETLVPFWIHIQRKQVHVGSKQVSESSIFHKPPISHQRMDGYMFLYIDMHAHSYYIAISGMNYSKESE